MKPIIDYDKTVQLFFAEILKYLNNMKSKTRDVKLLKNIDYAIWVASTVASNPKLYGDYNVRVRAGLEEMGLPYAFIPKNSQDNSVYLAFCGVVNSMGNLDNPMEYLRSASEIALLRGLKSVKYKNSTNMFKDFTYPFLSPAHFAIKMEKQY